MYTWIIIWILVLLTGWIFLLSSDSSETVASNSQFHIQTQLESNKKNLAINTYNNRKYGDSQTDQFMKIIDGYDLEANAHLQSNQNNTTSWTILENSKYDTQYQTYPDNQDNIYSEAGIDFWLYRVDVREEKMIEWWKLIDDLSD